MIYHNNTIDQLNHMLPCSVILLLDDLPHHNLLNQMKSCTEQLHEKDYVVQTHFTYESSSDESESDMICMMIFNVIVNLFN